MTEIISEIKIPVNYISIGVLPRNWNFPYSDSYFTDIYSEYSHKLAQSSLGFAVSADRNQDECIQNQNRGVRNFFESAGFDNQEFYLYDTVPTDMTVACAIASKKINDWTLVAVTVCGNGYGCEWEGNFTVGNSDIHKGFSSGAQLVKKNILSYLDKYNIQNCRLWLAGYSRAAAVLNIVGKELKEEKPVLKLYAYLFATPSVSKKPQNVEGMFNIINKNDFFAMLPDSIWGFGKNGKVLYLPAQEFDSNWYELSVNADAVAKELGCPGYMNNPILNLDYRQSYLLLHTIFPDSESYVKYLEPLLRSVYEDRSLKNVARIRDILLKNYRKFDKDRKKAVRLFKRFILGKVVSSKKDFAFQSSLNLWDSQSRLDTNLLHGHSGDMYVQWMFSSENSNELFSDNKTFEAVKISGKVIVNYDSYGKCKPFVLNLKRKSLICIPQDYKGTISITYKRKIKVQILKYHVGKIVPEELTSSPHVLMLNA